MASLQAVADIQLRDYISLVVITAVGYDYLLTLSKEIEYIWNKPWTWVSTLFTIARYFGLCFAMEDFLFSRLREGIVIYLFGSWCFWAFMCAADLLMILRVWALYGRSKLILGILSTIYVMEVLYFLVVFVIYSTHSRLNPTEVRTAQVLQFSFCETEYISTPIWDEALYAFQIAFGVLLCLLTSIKFIEESLEMYKVTKQFQLNRYMKRLAKDGMVYFITILLLALVNILGNAGSIPAGGWQIILAMLLQEIPSFTLIPRFVLSLRELHARDLQGRRGSGIDTEFGLGSVSTQGAAASTMVFADPGRNENEKQGDEIQVEERGAGICRATGMA